MYVIGLLSADTSPMDMDSSGCRNKQWGGSSSGSHTVVMDTNPGGPNCGWPQSASRSVTESWCASRPLMTRLARELLPVFLGPQINTLGGVLEPPQALQSPAVLPPPVLPVISKLSQSKTQKIVLNIWKFSIYTGSIGHHTPALYGARHRGEDEEYAVVWPTRGSLPSAL